MESGPVPCCSPSYRTALLLRLLGHVDIGARWTASKLLGMLVPALEAAQVWCGACNDGRGPLFLTAAADLSWAGACASVAWLPLGLLRCALVLVSARLRMASARASVALCRQHSWWAGCWAR